MRWGNNNRLILDSDVIFYSANHLKLEAIHFFRRFFCMPFILCWFFAFAQKRIHFNPSNFNVGMNSFKHNHFQMKKKDYKSKWYLQIVYHFSRRFSWISDIQQNIYAGYHPTIKLKRTIFLFSFNLVVKTTQKLN